MALSAGRCGSECVEYSQIECDMMRAKAKVDAESYWSEVHSRLENFYKEYNELQKILPIKDQ